MLAEDYSLYCFYKVCDYYQSFAAYVWGVDWRWKMWKKNRWTLPSRGIMMCACEWKVRDNRSMHLLCLSIHNVDSGGKGVGGWCCSIHRTWVVECSFRWLDVDFSPDPSIHEIMSCRAGTFVSLLVLAWTRCILIVDVDCSQKIRWIMTVDANAM